MALLYLYITDLLDVAGHGEDDWGASSGEESQSTKKPKKNCFAAPSKRKVRFDVAEGEESEESDSDLDMFNYDDADGMIDEESFETFKDSESDSEDKSKEDEVESKLDTAGTKYMPPQKREISQKLRKQVQGLINR